MAVDQAAMKAAFDVLDALAASAPMTTSDYNEERAKIIADAIKTGSIVGVEPGAATIPVT